ncbi:MAG: FHA domain-containing protein [Planctomycetaceae bacterium]
MGRVTFFSVDGLERGQVFQDLETPVMIGREEDNHIRLNDERVSRCHARVQEQQGKVIITDLDSTNGTRVNGHPVTVHVLQPGDQVLLGRCLLIFGSEQQLEQLADAVSAAGTGRETLAANPDEDEALHCPTMFNGPPPLPADLSALQTAEAADLIAYLHSELLGCLYTLQADKSGEARQRVHVSTSGWHRLQRLQIQMASYLKQISDPAE